MATTLYGIKNCELFMVEEPKPDRAITHIHHFELPSKLRTLSIGQV
ncbi:hypothetical protein [Aeromonas hydrophila]